MEKFQTVRGMRDFLPEKAEKKQKIEDICRRVFERYNFRPLQTPLVEEFKLLAKKGGGGEAIKDEIYYFKDKSDRELGLRFDLTVPLARVVANNPQLPKPFKTYQIGDVYRYDRPGEKRWRKFTQADVDILGVSSLLADLECLEIAVNIMKELGLKFRIKINNRKVLQEIASFCDIPKDKVDACFRCIDKLGKKDFEGVKKELKQKGLSTKILQVIDKGLKQAEELLKGKGIWYELKGLKELTRIAGFGDYVDIDLCLARGLEYYTGNIFEVTVENGPSVGGGGRYDKLIETYGGQSTPAVGISFGIDRILACIEEKGIGKDWAKTRTKVFVAPIYKELPDWTYEKGKTAKLARIPGKEVTDYIVQVANKIRDLGINCEMDLMMRNITRNIQDVNRRGIPIVVIVGEDELKKKEVTIKYLEKKKQKRIKLSNLEKEFKPLLK